MGVEPGPTHDEHHVRVLLGFEEVEKVARDVLEVLDVAQSVEVDAYGRVT